jgi:hypothetical protein
MLANQADADLKARSQGEIDKLLEIQRRKYEKEREQDRERARNAIRSTWFFRPATRWRAPRGQSIAR